MSLLVQLVEVFALLSVLSIGGANATLPEIHRQVVVSHHWMTDATFAQIVTIGQTAPGPNVMVASIIGWQLAGLIGLLVVTASIVLPSSAIAVVVGRFVARHEEGGTVSLVRRALAPIALGFMLASSAVMTRAAWQGAGTLMVVALVAATVVLTRLSPLWGIGGGALAGLVAHRLGWI